MDDRTKRRITFIIIIVAIIIVTTGLLIFQISRGYYNRIIKADEDTYVYEINPETNYGGDKDIFVGNYHEGKTEAYYHFEISSLPDGWREVELQIYFDYGSDMVNVGCNLTYESWDEMTITWNNKPNASFHFGHILCDGFGFRINLRPEDIINDEVTICLYGRGGEDDGYIQGPSREGTPDFDDPPSLWLEYEGLDPFFLIGVIVAYVVIGVTIAIYLKLRKLPTSSTTPRRYVTRLEGLRETRFQNHFEALRRERFLKPTKIFKINDLVDLRLINNRTYIFVNNKRLTVCTFLLINIPKEKIQDYDEIKSIDEAAEILDKSMERIPPYYYKISPEEEFKAHCSNIQAFFENGLNTNILHSNIAFPLLKELVQQGFEPAQKVFKEEIAIRFNEGTFNSRRFLYLRGYLNYLSEEEKQALKGYNDFIRIVPERLRTFGEMIERNLVFRNAAERIRNLRELRELYDRARPAESHFKIVIFGDANVGKNTLNRKFIRNVGEPNSNLTIGVNFAIKIMIVNKHRVRLQIWNLTNEERFRSLVSNYFLGANGGLFIYDITNYSSLTHFDEWLRTIRIKFREKDIFPIVVVGNKVDLSGKREVPMEDAIKFAKSKRLDSYIECSFKTGKNVEKMFERLVRLMLKKEKENR